MNQNVIETARMDGAKENALEIAKGMLAKGLDSVIIGELTGLNQTEIQKLI